MKMINKKFYDFFGLIKEDMGFKKIPHELKLISDEQISKL